jgi:DNA-directed RNA polymerase subunit RPC12/RpoP
MKTIKPQVCPDCGCTKFHKTERRMQEYQDIVNGHIVENEIERRRYRCVGCSTKLWDTIEGLDTYRRKTTRLLLHLQMEKHLQSKKNYVEVK